MTDDGWKRGAAMEEHRLKPGDYPPYMMGFNFSTDNLLYRGKS